jgi:DinB superfamily
MADEQPEVWLRGPVHGVEPLLMPVAHALLQVREDLERLATRVPAGHVWLKPGAAASLGFHVKHTGGALDRLFTYARGDALTDEQIRAARAEGVPGEPPAALAEIVADVHRIVDRALDQLRSATVESLLQPRRVGRAGLPSTTLGLLFHAAEHSTRHVGQAITTARVLSGDTRTG